MGETRASREREGKRTASGGEVAEGGGAGLAEDTAGELVGEDGGGGVLDGVAGGGGEHGELHVDAGALDADVLHVDVGDVRAVGEVAEDEVVSEAGGALHNVALEGVDVLELGIHTLGVVGRRDGEEDGNVDI